MCIVGIILRELFKIIHVENKIKMGIQIIKIYR